jgi:hypothetical protein
MSKANTRFRRGDLVEVRTPDEIGATLDADGTSGNLPFMPEMVELCGRTFRVSSRAFTVCYLGPGSHRAFNAANVFTLENVRCSGAAHDGCQKACTIFWRESWLRKAEATKLQSPPDQAAADRLRSRLKVSTGPRTYFCQSSELLKATRPLSRRQRLAGYLSGFFAGNFTAQEMIRNLGIWLFWLLRGRFFGVYARGSRDSTPSEALNLQPGEWVEVKSMQSIRETLDSRGHNRGLYFSPDMRLWCGRRCQVKGRLDKIIVDGSGRMRRLRDTVCLEGSTCGCAYNGFDMGGCSRCEITYWREIWLRRS